MTSRAFSFDLAWDSYSFLFFFRSRFAWTSSRSSTWTYKFLEYVWSKKELLTSLVQHSRPRFSVFTGKPLQNATLQELQFAVGQREVSMTFRRGLFANSLHEWNGLSDQHWKKYCDINNISKHNHRRLLERWANRDWMQLAWSDRGTSCCQLHLLKSLIFFKSLTESFFIFFFFRT